MLRILRGLFAKPAPQPEPGSSPEELWRADFSSPERCRFAPVDEARYSARLADAALKLDLHRGSLFAWVDAGDLRYSDVSVEAEIRFDQTGPRSSAGLLFRKQDDSSFLYVLVSSDGDVRLDLVFNGDPRPIVPWTACPWAGGTDSLLLSLVVRGPRIVVLVNGRFALEAEDDSLDGGGIAFAAQSYDEAASFTLVSLSIESRPVEAESDYVRFARVLEADSSQRRRLAESYFGLGYYVPALVQLRKIYDRGAVEARDKFLEAECLLRLDLKDEAALAIDACLAIDPGHAEAREERFNLLYLRGDYEELRRALEAEPEKVAASPRLANLLGHARYNMASWASAALAYGQAADADPAMPIYARNRAMALEKAGDRTAAAAAWLAAARGFYSQNAWDDSADCSSRLRQLGYDRAALDSLDGLVAYGRGEHASALSILSKLAKKGRADAPALYILGLLQSSGGKKAEAVTSFRKAAEQDQDKPIYRYRLAEALFLAGQPCADELDAALRAAPSDGWTLNLAGQAALARGKAAEAAGYFGKAREALPEEAAPAVNLSQALSDLGQNDQAVLVLGDWPRLSAAAANRLGNVMAATGNLDGAIEAYREACSLGGADPDLYEYRVNLAAALLERGELSDAEGVLRIALADGADDRGLRLMGDIAAELGDPVRAELAYRAALEQAPDNALNLGRLAGHYLARHKYELAASTTDRLATIDPGAAAPLKAAIKAASTETLSCAACGRAWELPRPTPPVPRTRLRGEPPDDSPAGSCPDCGKTYCVACRKDHLSGGRFTCPDCGSNLNLNDDRVRWLVLDRVKGP